MARGERGEKKDTKVVDTTLSVVTLRRLETLVRGGAFGVTRPEVIRHFVEAGLREARKENYISPSDWDAATQPDAVNTASTGG